MNTPSPSTVLDLRPTPSPEREDWVDFIYWFEARFPGQVAQLIHEPQNYAHDYANYLDQGGLDR